MVVRAQQFRDLEAKRGQDHVSGNWQNITKGQWAEEKVVGFGVSTAEQIYFVSKHGLAGKKRAELIEMRENNEGGQRGGPFSTLWDSATAGGAVAAGHEKQKGAKEKQI